MSTWVYCIFYSIQLLFLIIVVVIIYLTNDWQKYATYSPCLNNEANVWIVKTTIPDYQWKDNAFCYYSLIVIRLKFTDDTKFKVSLLSFLIFFDFNGWDPFFRLVLDVEIFMCLQMNRNKDFSSLTSASAHKKFDVWNGPLLHQLLSSRSSFKFTLEKNWESIE